MFKHFDDVHSINYLAKNHMFVVQKWGSRSCYKELATIGVRARILMLSVRYFLHSRHITQSRGVNSIRTAILNRPARSCVRVKFSSANFDVP